MNTSLYQKFETSLVDQKSMWVKPYVKPCVDDGAHQFLLFLKPEVTAVHAEVNVEGVLQMVLERLSAFQTSVHAVRILPSAYLAEHSIMDQHYGVINAISKQGESALTDAAGEKLKSEFGEDLKKGAKVLGGHQFLEEQSEFTALTLCTLSDNLGTTKLGGGSYCMRLDMEGQIYLVLNPFHAYQLVPFTSGQKAIIAMECRSNRDWKALRSDLTGSTDPSAASEGSIRSELLARKEEFNLAAVNQGSNGIHLSAGPLEGMVELKRFFTDHESAADLDLSDTLFGSQLIEAGIDTNRLQELAANITIRKGGQSESAFDLTEEVNASDALKRLL